MITIHPRGNMNVCTKFLRLVDTFVLKSINVNLALEERSEDH